MEEVRKVAQELVKVSADLIYKDSHQWSARPCSTCKTISNLLGIDFGCIRYAKAKDQPRSDEGKE